MRTFVIMYVYIYLNTLIFENFKGGGGACAPPAPPKSASEIRSVHKTTMCL